VPVNSEDVTLFTKALLYINLRVMPV